MDNVSHSVAGLIAGEIIHRSLPEEKSAEAQKTRRRLFLFCCWFASNFPDLDLILTPLLPSPLGYLLHHRGHTHTIVYALPQALLLMAGVWLLWPKARRLLKESAVVRKGFGLSIASGFALHLLMDYLNSYGIHPFHPFDNRWLFGDMVFIVEPFFWIAFGIPMAFTFASSLWRWFFAGLLFVLPIFGLYAGLLPWFSFLILLLIAGILIAVSTKSQPNSTAPFVLAAMLGLCFVGVQSFASGFAKRTIIEQLGRLEPKASFVDASASSYPTNPFCWSFTSFEANEEGNFYRLKRGYLSLAPTLLTVDRCPKNLSADDHSTLSKDSNDQIFYQGEERGDLAYFRKMAQENCHIGAWLRFARMPLVKEDEALDLRFARGPRGNFTTLKLKEFRDLACATNVPPWTPPRADLIGGTK